MTEAAEWRGAVGDVWAREWTRTERAFAGIGAHLDTAIAAAAPARGRALDIGCGVGSTALALAGAHPGLDVTGVDLSASLVAVARSRTPGRRPVFVVGDALACAADRAPLDLLVSRHGVMFFPDPYEAFAELAVAAAPGAPLVFSCFRSRAENDWAREIEQVLGITSPVPAGYQPGPYAYADPDWVGAMLAAAGWRDPVAAEIDAPWVVGGGADPVTDALDFFARIGPSARVLRDAAPDARAKMLDRLRALVETRQIGNEIRFTAAAWIWTARAGGAA